MRLVPAAPGVDLKTFRRSLGLSPDVTNTLDVKKVKAVCGEMAKGFSMFAACGKFRVPIGTMKQWLEEYPEVREAMDMAKMGRVHRIEEQLLDKTSKHPQVVASIFALKNVKPDEWSDRPETNTGLASNITIVTGVPEQAAPIVDQSGAAIEQQQELTLKVQVGNASQEIPQENRGAGGPDQLPSGPDVHSG
jgi:hypothetical protein